MLFGDDGQFRELGSGQADALEALGHNAVGGGQQADEEVHAGDLGALIVHSPLVGFAEEAEAQLRGREQVAGLKRLEVDHDNLRTALRWSLDRGETEVALRLGSALWLFWDTHGYVREGREWVADLLGQGWRRTDGPKDPQRKLHPLLESWEELSEAERDKDRMAVRELPEMLLRAGFEIYREDDQTAPARSADSAAGITT